MADTDDIGADSLVKIDKQVNLSHIIGQPEAVASLRDLARRIRWPEIYTLWGVSKPKAIALVGPPGTGKTVTLRALANEIECPLMELKYEDVASHLYDEAIKKLNVFKTHSEKVAEKYGHVLIFIDEADIFFQSRFDSNVHNSDQKKTNFFLRWIDGDLDSSNNFTIVVASNAWETIDPALRRSGRFIRIDFKSLSAEDVVACIRVHIELAEKRTGREMFVKTDLDSLIETVDEITGADVKEIVDQVLLMKANEHLDKLLETESDGVVEMSSVEMKRISAEDLAVAITKQRTVLKPKKRGVGF